VIDSLFLVNTSIDVVRILEANGLYSPAVVFLVGVGVAEETTSKEDDDDAGGETESDDEVEEKFETVVDEIEDGGGTGIR
jgi:hypothetical protein